jgi:hypothetical protein
MYKGILCRFKKKAISQAWWHKSVNQALRRLRLEFISARLGCLARPYPFP